MSQQIQFFFLELCIKRLVLEQFVSADNAGQSTRNQIN